MRVNNSKTVAFVLYCWHTFGVILILFPLLLGMAWFMSVNDNNNTTDYLPDPFPMIIAAAVVESLFAALAIVSLHRTFAWLSTKFKHESRLQSPVHGG